MAVFVSPLKGLGPQVPILEMTGLGRACGNCSAQVRFLLDPGEAEAGDCVPAGPGCPGSQQEGPG